MIIWTIECRHMQRLRYQEKALDADHHKEFYAAELLAEIYSTAAKAMFKSNGGYELLVYINMFLSDGTIDINQY